MPRPTDAHVLGDDSPDLSKINLGLYAHPGRGKTVLGGGGRANGTKLNVPHSRGIIIADGDGTRGLAAASQGSKATIIPMEDYDAVRSVYEWMVEDLLPKNKLPKWFVWDSVTLFQDRSLIDDITWEAHQQNPNQSEFVPSQREYLIDHNRIKTWIRRFVKLPCNCLFTFHVAVDEDPEGNLIYMPAVQGRSAGVSMSSIVTGYLNVVGYMDVVDNKRKILFQPSNEFYAKDQFHALGKVMTDPTLPKIEEKIATALAARRSSQPAANRRRGTATGRRKASAK
jgi:hypothetical protein